MPVSNLIDFYRRNLPSLNSEPFKQDGEWVSGTTPDITIDPQADEMLLVTHIDIVVPRDLDLNSSDIEVQGWKDGKGGTKLTFSDLEDLMQKSDKVVYFDTGATTEEIKVTLKANPPVKLTHTGAETIVFHNSVGTTHTITTGWVRFAVHGWFLSESDY